MGDDVNDHDGSVAGNCNGKSMRIKVHYDGSSEKYDEWIDIHATNFKASDMTDEMHTTKYADTDGCTCT